MAECGLGCLRSEGAVRAFEKLFGYFLLASVMFAGGIAAVQYFGDGDVLPPELKNATYFLGGAGAIYWIWSMFTDALSAWREAGGMGFFVKFIRNFFPELFEGIFIDSIQVMIRFYRKLILTHCADVAFSHRA